MIRAGRLRNRVILENPTITTDASGGESKSWSVLATVWAAVEPIRGREFFSGQESSSDISIKVTLRYLQGITEQTRVLLSNGDVLDIAAPPIDVESRHRRLELMCKRHGS